MRWDNAMNILQPVQHVRLVSNGITLTIAKRRDTGEVLMLIGMNTEVFARSLQRGRFAAESVHVNACDERETFLATASSPGWQSRLRHQDTLVACRSGG